MFFHICAFSLAISILYYVLRYLWELIPLRDLCKKAVFVTGCDTGFGRLLALKLAKNGILTYAGCLTETGRQGLCEEAKRLKIECDLLIPLPLDVTDDESVKSCKNFVKTNLPSDRVFWCLVNNAGVFSCYGPDAWTPLDEYRKSLDINLFGAIRCVHEFLPLLKQSRGRIVTVASVAGRMAFPGGAPYHVAKYGVEAYMDSIRRELELFGIGCSILEPGAFRTNLLNPEQMTQRVNTIWKGLSPELKNEYGEEYKDRYVNNWNRILMANASDRFHYVVDCYYHAITAKFPRLRYRCGWDATLLFIPMSFMPTVLGDAIFKLLATRNAPIPAAIANKQKNM